MALESRSHDDGCDQVCKYINRQQQSCTVLRSVLGPSLCRMQFDLKFVFFVFLINIRDRRRDLLSIIDNYHRPAQIIFVWCTEQNSQSRIYFVHDVTSS